MLAASAARRVTTSAQPENATKRVSTAMKTLKSTTHWTLYSLIAITVIAIGFGVYRSQQSAATTQAPRQEPPAQAGSLVSLKPSVDLGTISMAAGNVAFRHLL